MRKKYAGYLELFKQRTLPLLSLNGKRKSTSSPKGTKPKTPK